MEKPYLLTLASNTEGMDRFLDTLPEVEHIAVQFLPYNPKLEGIKTGVRFPGHFDKWRFVPEGLDPERYIVFSDTSDVIFQGELPEFKYDLYLAPETVDHQNTIWTGHIDNFPSLETLRHKEVINCGTFAMKVKHMYEYRDFIYEFDKEGYGAWSQRLEQIYFNMFVHSRPDLSKVYDRSLFCALFANVYHGVKKVDGVWMDGDRVIKCVHANGGVELKKQL